MSTRLNRQIFVETIVYFIAAISLAYFTVTKKYMVYVTPRMEPFLYFMIALLLLWGFANLPYLFKRSYKNRYFHIFILIIPTLFLFMPIPDFISHSPAIIGQEAAAKDVASTQVGGSGNGTVEAEEVDAASKPHKGALADDPTRYGSKPLAGSDAGFTPGSTGDATVKATQTSGANSDNGSSSGGANDDSDIGGFGGSGDGSDSSVTITKSSASNIGGIDTNNHRVTLNTKNFYRTIMELTRDPNAYAGYSVTITGYIIRDHNYFSKGNFFIGRMAMTCCIADIAPVGLTAFYGGGAGYSTGAWVTATGHIVKTDYHGMPQAGIKITSIRPASPIKGYVYP